MTAPPPPTEVSPKEALRFPVVVTVPTSGLTERIVPSVPKWLASMLLIIPLFGLLQLASATSNDCGQGGELLADRVTGTLINCDGSPFEGRGTPGGSTDFIALGEQVFTGQVVAAANCQSCHGAQGQGVRPRPDNRQGDIFELRRPRRMGDQRDPGFPKRRAIHLRRFEQAGGRSWKYAGFGAGLTPEQIGAAAAFERVRFGGVPPEEALSRLWLGPAAPERGRPREGAPKPGARRGEEAPAEERHHREPLILPIPGR